MSSNHLTSTDAFYGVTSMCSDTLKRQPSPDWSKDDLLQLLSYFEGELQARDITIAVLKAEKAKQLLYQVKYGRYGQSDPYTALQRDAFGTIDSSFDESSVNMMYDNQLTQLENLIATQHGAQMRMGEQLSSAEKRYCKVCSELDDERRKHAQDTAQGDDVTYMLEKERGRLRQEIDFEKSCSKKLEKDLKRTLSALEQEQALAARHKHVALLLLKERTHMLQKLSSCRPAGSLAGHERWPEPGSTVEAISGMLHDGCTLGVEAEFEAQLTEFDDERAILHQTMFACEGGTHVFERDDICVHQEHSDIGLKSSDKPVSCQAITSGSTTFSNNCTALRCPESSVNSSVLCSRDAPPLCTESDVSLSSSRQSSLEDHVHSGDVIFKRVPEKHKITAVSYSKPDIQEPQKLIETSCIPPACDFQSLKFTGVVNEETVESNVLESQGAAPIMTSVICSSIEEHALVDDISDNSSQMVVSINGLCDAAEDGKNGHFGIHPISSAVKFDCGSVPAVSGTAVGPSKTKFGRNGPPPPVPPNKPVLSSVGILLRPALTSVTKAGAMRRTREGKVVKIPVDIVNISSCSSVGETSRSGSTEASSSAAKYVMDNNKGPGTFLLRPSTRFHGALTLTISIGKNKARHINVQQCQNELNHRRMSFFITSDKAFPSFSDLCQYYTFNPINNMEHVDNVKLKYPLGHQNSETSYVPMSPSQSFPHTQIDVEFPPSLLPKSSHIVIDSDNHFRKFNGASSACLESDFRRVSQPHSAKLNLNQLSLTSSDGCSGFSSRTICSVHPPDIDPRSYTQFVCLSGSCSSAESSCCESPTCASRTRGTGYSVAQLPQLPISVETTHQTCVCALSKRRNPGGHVNTPHGGRNRVKALSDNLSEPGGCVDKNECRPPMPLPKADSAALESVYYSSPRDDRNTVEEIKDAFRMSEMCDCGLRLVDAELADGWTVHRSRDAATYKRVFYQHVDGITTWDFPHPIAELLNSHQLNLVTRLYRNSNQTVPPVIFDRCQDI